MVLGIKKPELYNMELAAWMSGEFGRGWIGVYTYVWVPLLSTLSITTLLISCTPLQNKKLKKKTLSFLTNCPHPQLLPPFPTWLFHLKYSFLRKRSNFEMINLKVCIVALFEVSILETISMPKMRSIQLYTRILHYLAIIRPLKSL